MAERHYINGRWVLPRRGGSLPNFNPATEGLVGEYAAGTAEDVASAVDAAQMAFSGWKNIGPSERASCLRALAAQIRTRREDLARTEVVDNGKPLPEALWDVDDAAGCFEFYADLAERSATQETITVPDERFECVVRYEPVGVVGQIIPWNYPLLMAAWKVAPALAAGCTCVLKPSEYTPLTALELGRIADEVGLPPGVLNVVTGTGPEAGEPLVAHPNVRKIAFTGSVPTGRRVMQLAAQDIKNVSLELGGKSPMVVFADADLRQAIEWIMFGIFWNQGQVCSATSRLLVEESIAPRLLEELASETAKITVGNGLTPGVVLGPLVSASQHGKVLRHIAEGHAAGARLVSGGKRPPSLPQGYFIEPTIFSDVPRESALWQQEIFGPVLCVRRFRTEAEAVAEANGTPFGLAAAVMSADAPRCQRVAAALEAGIVWINCSQPTFTQAPWGGVKRSGIGRELGRWGFESYREPKQITRYTSAAPWGWYLK